MNQQPFSDMKPLLIVFGVLKILAGLGCGCYGMIYGMFFPAMMSAAPPSSAGPEAEMLQSMGSIFIGVGLMFVAMSTCLIWLGIGSIMARTWARDITYAFGWLWGVITVFIMILMIITVD